MKIRIRDNSVRFRLSQSEVRQLGDRGIVSSSTQFIDKTLVYAVAVSDNTEMSASFADNKIVLNMPKAIAEEWVDTERVGFEGQTGVVKLLIEKDFVCIDNSTEDQSDNYPNPNMKC